MPQNSAPVNITDAAGADDFAGLIEDAKAALTAGKHWNRSQVERYARRFFGPLVQVRGKDAEMVHIYTEQNGRRFRLGTGKATNGAGAFKDALIATFIKPLEHRLKLEEARRAEVKATAEKAKVLAEQIKAEHEATLANPDATEEAKDAARKALETYATRKV